METDRLQTRANELRRQLAERPDDVAARAELARVTAELGDYASAIDHDAQAWTRCPEDPMPMLHMLGMLVDSGKWLGALVAIEIARTGAHPDTALVLDLAATEAFRQIGGVFPPRGARPEADAIIDRLVASCRMRRVSLQAAIARTLIDLGRTTEAATLLDQAREVTETSDLAHVCFLKGLLCERAGDLAGAATLYQQAHDLDGRTDAALNLLSILVESPEPAAATQTAALLARLGSPLRELPLVRFREAIHLRRIGDHDAATTLLSPIACDHSSELGRMARQVLASC
jgi:thioredoxin-like negative regulator of GroEL